MYGQAVCRMHGGATQASRNKAKERILAAADPAAANLVRWMGDPKVDMRLRVQIAQDLLDRANVSGKTTVEVEASVTFETLIAGVIAEVPEGTEGISGSDYGDRLNGGDVIAGELADEPFEPDGDEEPDREAARVRNAGFGDR